MKDIDIINEIYPEVIVNDEIDYKKLSILLAQELTDIQDELNEKDYQILHIMEEIDKIKNR